MEQVRNIESLGKEFDEAISAYNHNFKHLDKMITNIDYTFGVHSNRIDILEKSLKKCHKREVALVALLGYCVFRLGKKIDDISSEVKKTDGGVEKKEKKGPVTIEIVKNQEEK